MLISTNPGGIANRLKNLLSAMRKDPDAKIVWLNNDRCSEPWSSLFTNNIEVKDTSTGTQYQTWRLDIAPDDGIPEGFCTKEFYGSDTKYKDIDFEYQRIPYCVRKVYLRLISRLNIHPNIQQRVDHLSKNFNKDTVSVHIRTWNDCKERHDKYHSLEAFIYEMDKVLLRNPNTTFYVCSDSKSCVDTLRGKYGDKIISYDGESSLTELLLLSKNSLLIGSYVSTFSEMAWWFGGCKADVVIVKKGNITLHDLALQFGTDKATHNFCKIYDAFFSHMKYTANTVIEVGVFFGASINMWKSYFDHAIIHGADHFTGVQGNGSKFANPLEYYNKMRSSPDPRISLHNLDQSKDEQLSKFSSNFMKGTVDVIVDDGSHLMYDQQRTFIQLFPLVRAGGYFVLEDVHTSNQGGYDVKADGSNSTLKMIEKFIETKEWHSVYMTKDEMKFLNENTDRCLLFKNTPHSMTCLIQRKVGDNRNSCILDTVCMLNYSNEIYRTILPKYYEWAFKWTPTLITYGPKDIDTKFFNKNASILTQFRGNGYWMWKPYFILNTMLTTNAEYIVYCDTGSSWNVTWNDIKQSLRDKWLYMLDIVHMERKYTKRDCFIKMGMDEEKYTGGHQYCATVLAFRRCDESIKFLNEWITYLSDPQMITDSPSVNANYPEFQEHRHDQSVFSLLCKKYGIEPSGYGDKMRHRCFIGEYSCCPL